MSKLKDKWITIKVLTEQYDEVATVTNQNQDFISIPEFYRVAASKLLRSLKK